MANEFIARKGLISLDDSTVSGSLTINTSGSTVFDIQGSQGQLFSVTDSLTGVLMSVNDISGLPILEVSSDDKVVMGTFGAEGLIVTGSNVNIGKVASNTHTVTGSLNVSGSQNLVGELSITSSAAGPTVLLYDSTAGNDPFIRFVPATTTNAFAVGIDDSDSDKFKISYGSNAVHGTNDRLTIDTSGNVGIGNTTPLAPLDIRTGSAGANTFTGLEISATGMDVGGGTAVFLRNTGNIVVSSRYGARIRSIRRAENNGAADIAFDLEKTDASGLEERMRITGNGNVGIGTTTPNAKLDVNGNTIISGSTTLSGSLFVTSSGVVSIGTLSPFSASLFVQVPSGSSNSIFRAYNSGTLKTNLREDGVQQWYLRSGNGQEVGMIGFSTPGNSPGITYTDVGGTSRGDFKLISGSGGWAWSAHSAAGFPPELMRLVGGTGRLGIGTSSPNAKLDVNGDAIVTGSLTTTLTGSFAHVLPLSDNTGTVGTSALTWANGQFTNFTVDSALTAGTITTTGNAKLGDATADIHTVTGSLRISGSLQLAGGFTANVSTQTYNFNNGDLSAVNQVYINDPGEGIVFGGNTSGDVTIRVEDDSLDNRFRIIGQTNTRGEILDTLYVTGSNVGVGISTPTKTFTVQINDSNTAVATGRNLGGGGAGAGMKLENVSAVTDTYANLDFRANTADGRIALVNKGVNTGEFHFITDNGGSPTSHVVIQDDGDVGIGTTSPTAKLQVVGQISGSTVRAAYSSSDGTGGITTTNTYLDSSSQVYEFEFKNGILIRNEGPI